MTTSERTDVLIPAIAWKTLACVSLTGFMASIEVTIIALALQDVREAFPDDSEAMFSWVFNAYNITFAAALLPAGWISDRFGRGTIFIAGTLSFLLGSLLAGIAPSLDFLIAARVLQGIGGAFQAPAGMALLLAAFPEERRQLGIGIWGATGGLAAAFGPTVGAFLVDSNGWRMVFLINVPVAMLILAVAPRWLLPSAPNPMLGRVDLVAVPMATAGVGAIIGVIVRADEWGWGSSRTTIWFVVGVVLVAAFVIRSSRHSNPLFDLGLFRLRSFAVGAVGQTAFVAAFFLWLVPFPTFLRTAWGWSVLKAGFAIAPGPLMAMVSAPIAGKLADSIGPRIPLVVSGLVGTIGVTLQVRYLSLEPNYLTGMLPATLLIGIAAGIGFSGTVGAIVAEVRPDQFGMAGAARSTIFQLSVALSIAVSFTIIGRPETAQDFLVVIRRTWMLALSLYSVQFVFFFALYPRREQLFANR